MTESYARIRNAMMTMRDKGRIVKIPRERGYILIEAKTEPSPANGRELVDHYLVRWRGDDVLPSYWTMDDPLSIQQEISNAETFEIVRKEDVDLDM